MLARIRKAQEEREGGFTLIELLVVIIIIGILAAIAIPTFLRQREKGYKADMKSTAKNAATAVESYATDSGGSYAGVGLTQLSSEGFKKASSQTVAVASTASTYCIFVTDTRLADKGFKYTSASGAPAEVANTATCTSGTDY